MKTRILIMLATVASLGLLWGCGDDEETGGAAGTAGASTGGASGQAGQAGGATGGAAGSTAGAAGEAGAAGAAGEAGAAGSAGGGACGTSKAPATHTDCMTAGTTSAGHLPGKEQAKTNCVSCHTADLGKVAKNQCWSCHDPASQYNLHDQTIAGKKHKSASGGGKGATNPACSACHLDANSLGGNTCGTCH